MKEQIEKFLAQDELDYDEAVRLYAMHEGHNAAQLRRYQKRAGASHMLTHVIYSLEMFIGQKESGRAAIYGLEKVVKREVPTMLSEVEQEVTLELKADKKHTKSFDELSVDEKALVLKKRDLNNQLDQDRKELLATGEKNEPELVAKRKFLIQRMDDARAEIRAIWEKLNIEPEKLLSKENESEGEKQEDGDEFPPEYYKRKDDLKKLRDKLRKQEKAAETNATDKGRENAAKSADDTRNEIGEAEKWFAENGFEL